MKRTRKRNTLAAIAALLAITMCGPVRRAAAQAAAQDQGKTEYTPAQYNTYTAAANQPTPAAKVRALEDFLQKDPTVSLQLQIPALKTIWFTYFNDLKNYPKTVEFADKLMALGDKVDDTTRLQAIYYRSLAFHTIFNSKAPDAKAQATSELAAAKSGIQLLGAWKKPEGATDEQFAQSKKQFEAMFTYSVGFAALELKDYPAAVEGFKAALVADPNNSVSYFRLGVAYLSMTPPQYLDGFWALARSISLKGPTESQVRPYLRGQLLRYQQPACDNLIDPQMNELLALAAGSAARPDSYKFPSSADLDAARKDMTIASVFADLKAGGDKAKITWLAACGLEFPDVPSKVIEVVPGDPIVLKVAFVTSDEEFKAKTKADMEVKVVGQPEAARVEKDNPARFTATLVSYDPDPLLVHWDKAKVNPEDIPEQKKQPAKKAPPRRRAPAKRPG